MFPHPASLLEHPSLPAWEQSLKERIDRDLPKQAEIVAPRNQAVSRLYELVDLDRNGKDEAITFYRSEQDGRFTIHLLVHERQGEEWRLVTRQTVADGRAIDRLEVVSDARHKQNVSFHPIASASHDDAHRQLDEDTSSDQSLVS